MISERVKRIIEEHDETDEFKYMLLDRMRLDCNYFLGNGGRHEKFLWAGSVEKHIENMKAIYNSFSDENKPVWLTMEQIEEFEREMLK